MEEVCDFSNGTTHFVVSAKYLVRISIIVVICIIWLYLNKMETNLTMCTF